MGLAAASCSDSDNGGGGLTPPPTNSFYNFATYNGSTADASSFSVQREGDAPAATVTFSRTFTDKQLKPGNRVYMAYTTTSGQQYVSGPGTLYSLTDVTGGKPVPATSDNSVRRSSPIKLASMERTGNYLNLIFQVAAVQSLSKLQLTVKENPKEPEYPMLGLYVRGDNEDAAYRYARVSFDIKDVLAPADVQGVKVEYFGATGIDTLTFNKSNGAGTITPMQ